jgi:hypothetical protein
MFILVMVSGRIGAHEKINDKDGNGPADHKVDKHERKTEQGDRLVEYMQKRKGHHDYSENKEDNPRFPQLQSVHYSFDKAFHFWKSSL